MSVNYTITMPNELSKDFLDYLVENYDCKISRMQHSVEGKMLNIDITVFNLKQNTI